MPPFLPGVQLAREYWFEVVAPVLDAHVPSPERAAALLFTGSDVLGFDTEQSTDHGWGPRVFVFLPDGTEPARLRELVDVVDGALPDAFRGFPTRFPPRDGMPPCHQVWFRTVGGFVDATLGFDPRHGVGARDWLRTPTQLLRELTAGAVFEDGLGDLTRVRAELAWYPDDVWRYVLACQWRRIAQEEAFVGRCGQVGDELGSAIVAARLVRDVVRLGFLIERDYAPYSKWLGTAFARLPCATALRTPMQQTLAATDWQHREAHLCLVLERVAERFNQLELVEAIDPVVRPFFRRPFRVLDANRFADACFASTSLRALGWAGAVDQFFDSTDVLSGPQHVAAVAASHIWTE
ncbi:MAG: DUF4037 domain-containing protein [Acidimicrobiia bacterium]